ncbi:MAG: thiamine phosphate synthase [Nitrospiria bacterium]
MVFRPLYLIADRSLYNPTGKDEGAGADLFFEAVENAIEAGVRLIQYRDKRSGRGRIYETAMKLRKMTRSQDVRFIVNDEVDLAMAVKADGVHLGQGDLPPRIARQLLGEEAIIGLSTHGLEEAVAAATEPIDYIGFGPIFKTKTKPSEYPPVGIAAIAQIRKHVALPIYAIGGIRRKDLAHIASLNRVGVAVASALAHASKETIGEWQNALRCVG